MFAKINLCKGRLGANWLQCQTEDRGVRGDQTRGSLVHKDDGIGGDTSDNEAGLDRV